jgi:hypothetical protein
VAVSKVAVNAVRRSDPMNRSTCTARDRPGDEVDWREPVVEVADPWITLAAVAS